MWNSRWVCHRLSDLVTHVALGSWLWALIYSMFVRLHYLYHDCALTLSKHPQAIWSLHFECNTCNGESNVPNEIPNDIFVRKQFRFDFSAARNRCSIEAHTSFGGFFFDKGQKNQCKIFHSVEGSIVNHFTNAEGPYDNDAQAWNGFRLLIYLFVHVHKSQSARCRNPMENGTLSARTEKYECCNTKL